MQPEVSIVIPVHNAAPYVRSCLDSVLAQTCGAYEVICADDASVDGSREVLDEYARADARFKVISGSFGGPSATRNEALKLACAPYIAFLDADDWWDAHMLEKTLVRARREDAQIVVFDYWLYNEGQGLSTYRDQAWFAQHDGDVVDLATCPGLAGFVGVWDRLFRRDALVGHGFLNGLLYEDAVYCVESLLGARRIAIMADHLYYYRRGVQASITQTEDASRKHELDFLVAQGYIQECLLRAGVSREAWESYARYFAEYAYMHQRAVVPHSRFRAFFDEVRSMACRPEAPQLFSLYSHDSHPGRNAYLASVRANAPEVAWIEAKALNAVSRILRRQ